MAEEQHTGGMIALVPNAEGLAALAIDGGDPTDQLHLTLAYLGEDVTGLDPRVKQYLLDTAADMARTLEPLELSAFAHASFNPSSDEFDPCAVYLFNGDGVGDIHDQAAEIGETALGDAFPPQHANFFPHVTAGYSMDAAQLEYTGPVVFDTLRVALGNEVFDVPLGGAMTAALPVPDLAESEGIPVTFPVIIVEGLETSDGRYIEAGALGHRALPLPILAQTRNPEGGDGHAGAEVIGRLDTLERVPGPEVISKETGLPFDEGVFIWRGTGVIDPAAPGTALAQKGYLTGNSADLSDVEAEFVWGEDDEEDLFAGPEQIRMTSGKIAATTLVPIPAFAEAFVQIDGAQVEPAEDLDRSLVSSAWRSPDVGDDCLPCQAQAAELTAGANVAELPPVEAFLDPQLDGPTPLTVDTETLPGWTRVYGHLATWGTCHTGFAGQCVTPPHSASEYAYFHVGAVQVREGDQVREVAVGHITMGEGGHASTGLSAEAAAAHYDNVNTVVSDIAVGDDAYGIWFSGLVRTAATPEQVHALRAAPLSGDWRNYGNGLELVAALAVNTPGFPVPRARVASGAPQALVAAGVVHPDKPQPPVDLEELTAAVAQRLRGQARHQQNTRIAELTLRQRAAKARMQLL
jgi:hypothetical protein